MAFREVGVHEIKEVLRLWLRGEGLRSIARLARVDRKTARRYVEAAAGCGLDRAGGEAQLGDELLSAVAEHVRPHRSGGRGDNWVLLAAHHARLKELLGNGLTVVRAGELLAREGVVVPQRTLHRYALEVLGYGRASRQGTVPVADCEPGAELQADFGRMGLLDDPATGRRRVTHALILTAVYSRHMFVYLTFRQDLAAVIAGFEAAWVFFGGVFRVVIVDNMAPVVDRAHPLDPRLNRAFAEYAQDRGFAVDPARIRSPQDKGGVEGQIGWFRRNHLVPVPDVPSIGALNAMIDQWDADDEARRIGGRARTVGEFLAIERPLLRPLPAEPFETGLWLTPRVDRFAQVMVRNNRYSVPVQLIGRRVRVLLHASDLVIYDGRAEVARHERLPGRSGARLDLDHYLEALVRKPGATALEQARAAGKFTPVHDAWWAAARKAHGDAAGTRALVEVLLLHRHTDGEHVVAGLAAALRAGALTADAVALEARKAADEADGQPGRDTAPAGPPAVASLTARRLDKLPPDTRPLPSVAAYDQLLRRNRTAQEGPRP